MLHMICMIHMHVTCNILNVVQLLARGMMPLTFATPYVSSIFAKFR